MNVWKSISAYLLAFTLIFQPVLGMAQTSVGKTQKIAKLVEGVLGTSTRTVALRDPVYKNEKISTGSDSAAEFKFIDDTTLTLGPDTNMIIDELVFDGTGNQESLVLSMVQGTFKFVSGKMKSKAYVLKTPTVTVGIRGTVFTVYVAANGATTVSVVEGAVTVSNAAGVSQSVTSGFSSTTPPAPAGGTPPPPSTPGAPPPNASAAVQQMNGAVANAQSVAGAATGSATAAGSAAVGGVTVGAVAAGIAIAAAIAVAVSAIAVDDNTSTTTTTTTTTTTN